MIRNLPQCSKYPTSYDWLEGSFHLLEQNFFPFDVTQPRVFGYFFNAVGAQTSLRVSHEQLNEHWFTLLMKSMAWGDHLYGS